MSAPLRTAVIIDYQNLHMTGHDLFTPERKPHESLIHPGYYARKLIQERNSRQADGYDKAALVSTFVYRGLPEATHDPKPNAWNLKQAENWEQDKSVIVTHKPLKYTYERTATGARATDSKGRSIIKGKKEKGIDVLCALALVRESQREDIDLVILACQDTDLAPALDEAIENAGAKIETASWYDPADPWKSKEIRPTNGRRVWNTRMNENAFFSVLDLTTY